jgi:acyl-CoA synthetase (AMP-forming)/AMP-acid ligase II
MLPTTVRAAAARFGPEPVFVDPQGRALSYADLDRHSDEVATGLAAAGIGPGTVLGLALGTGVAYVVAYVAAAKLGAATAGVNPRLTPVEQERLLAVVEPTLVLASDDEVDALAVAGAPPPPELAPDPDRLVAIVFTSGTTGLPKGATFTNRQLEAITAADVGEAWGGGGAGVGATSLAHVGFMTKLPGHLRRGGVSFLLARWTADDALRLISEHRMANLGGVPTQLALLLRHPDLDRYDLSCVQSIVLGGGPAPLPLLREARDRLGAPVSVRYSSTESGGCGTGTAFEDPLDEHLGVGLPRGPVELSIRTGDGAPLPTGEVGEICLRSPTAMTGYFGNAEATAAAFWADGSVRTGDLGYVDGNGRLFLAGRSKEMYVRGGYNVYPMEVEGVLLDHPGVAAVAVVARPDEVLGERGVAVVVPADPGAPPSLDELRAFARERVSSYKLPDDVRLIDALPLTAMDKVDRRALEALLADQSPDGPRT